MPPLCNEKIQAYGFIANGIWLLPLLQITEIFNLCKLGMQVLDLCWAPGPQQMHLPMPISSNRNLLSPLVIFASHLVTNCGLPKVDAYQQILAPV